MSADTNPVTTTHLLELAAGREPRAHCTGCCPKPRGRLLLDTAPESGGADWRPLQYNTVTEEGGPSPWGLSWLAPWLCANPGVWFTAKDGGKDPASVRNWSTRGPKEHLSHRDSQKKTILKKSPCTQSKHQASFQTFTLWNKCHQALNDDSENFRNTVLSTNT